MPRTSTALNQTLTDYAKGVFQRRDLTVGDIIAPITRTGSTIGRYKAYDDKNAFVVEDTRRAKGGESNTIAFDSTDPSYDCDPHGLKYPLDDTDQDAMGQGDPLGQMEAYTEMLLTRAAIARENRIIQKITSSLTAVADRGAWGDNTVDPIKELGEQIKAIGLDCGMPPNEIVMGPDAWWRLINNAKVHSRFPGTELINITPEIVSRALNMGTTPRISVGWSVKDSNPMGASRNNSFIVGSEVFLLISQQEPSRMDPTAFKTFVGPSGAVDQVLTYRSQEKHSDIVEVVWSEDIKQTSTIGAKRITTTDS